MRKLWKALNEITGKEPWRKKAHRSCSITPSPLSTPGKHGNCNLSPIGSKSVYKTKHNPDGSTQYKAWLVIKGYEQTDFGETSAPVGKVTTFRYLISLIGRYGWNMDHLNVVTAFLNPEIDNNDIYMTLPEGWPEGHNAPKIIVRLRKALYGLKQAPRLWHDVINAFLHSLGFTQSLADPNLYLRSDGILILL
jgi:hypothetical protein